MLGQQDLPGGERSTGLGWLAHSAVHGATSGYGTFVEPTFGHKKVFDTGDGRSQFAKEEVTQPTFEGYVSSLAEGRHAKQEPSTNWKWPQS